MHRLQPSLCLRQQAFNIRPLISKSNSKCFISMHAGVAQGAPGDPGDCLASSEARKTDLFPYKMVISAHYGQQSYITPLFLLSSDVSGLRREDHGVRYKWWPFRWNSACRVRVTTTPASELPPNKGSLKCVNVGSAVCPCSGFCVSRDSNQPAKTYRTAEDDTGVDFQKPSKS